MNTFVPLHHTTMSRSTSWQLCKNHHLKLDYSAIPSL